MFGNIYFWTWIDLLHFVVREKENLVSLQCVVYRSSKVLLNRILLNFWPFTAKRRKWGFREINECMCMVAQICKNQYYQLMIGGLHDVCFSLTMHDVLNTIKGLQPYRCKYCENCTSIACCFPSTSLWNCDSLEIIPFVSGSVVLVSILNKIHDVFVSVL